jgi:polyhydroxyalkanoate synthase
LQHGLRVYLLEWRPPSRRCGNCGLAEYADGAISAAIAAVSSEIGRSKPFLMGHSLGGTLAAISAVLHAKHLSGLVLLSAPLCVYPGASPYWDTLATIAPFCLPELQIIPGSVLSQMSAMASPETFVWSRLLDAAASAADPRTSAIRLRAERWALDEVPLSGQLVRELFLWLCRENRLCKGTLALGGRAVRPFCARLPTLAVANAIDEVAPPASMYPFLEVMSQADTRLIEYPREFGVVLQHLGILLGQDALAQTWPKIISWINAHTPRSATKGSRWV